MTNRMISLRGRRVWRSLMSLALVAVLSVPALALAQSAAPASSSSSAQSAQQAAARQKMMEQMRARMQQQMQSLVDRMNEPGVRSFKLSNDFLNKFVAVSKDARNMKNKPHIDPRGTKNTAELAKKLDANASIHKVLKKHHLSAQRYVRGSMALTAVMMKTRLSKVPSAAKFVKQIHVSDHNMDFYKKNKTHIQTVMKSMRQPAPGKSH